MACLHLIRSIRQRPVYFYNLSAKYFTNHPMKFVETENKWREQDDVSKRWQLIYKAPMNNIMNYVSVYLTFTTTTVAVAALYYVSVVFDIDEMDAPIILNNNIIMANNAEEFLIYLGAFIGFHIAIKILLSKYVLRLYQNGDKYLAIFKGSSYNSFKKHEFHLKEFKKLNPKIVFAWGNARFALGNKKGILLENYFKTPEHFNYLLYKKSADNCKD